MKRSLLSSLAPTLHQVCTPHSRHNTARFNANNRQALYLKAFLLGTLLALGLGYSDNTLADDSRSFKSTDQWLMAKYDSNNDSVISAEEISQKREKMFSSMDDNGDGQVSLAEYELLDAKKRALIVQARFTKLDANADGKLTTEEYVQYYGAFGAFDLDGDGKITPQEINLDTGAAPHAQVSANAAPKCFLWVCVRSSTH